MPAAAAAALAEKWKTTHTLKNLFSELVFGHSMNKSSTKIRQVAKDDCCEKGSIE